jgi:gentisate 1,2-dioxygenase
VEGRGTARIEGVEHPLAERDLLVVPSWHALELRADTALVLFGYSDKAAQQKLGLWREERLD